MEEGHRAVVSLGAGTLGDLFAAFPVIIDKTTFQATTVAFFFALNWLKLGPYAWLGQLDASNLATSLVLAPLAPIGIALGAYLHHRIDEPWFYRVVYASPVVLGVKLIRDGVVQV